jgi:hypothetical protein
MRIKATFNVAGSAKGGLSKMTKEIAREQFPSRIKATFNVADSAKSGLSKMTKEIAREQFPSRIREVRFDK